MLHELVKPIVDYLTAHPQMGMLIAFLVSFSESLPIIGTIVPGSVTMTAVGTLIGTGILPLDSTLFWASIGALSGDTLGFWVGSFFQDGIRKLWPFSRYPHWLTHSENFFKKHGGKSIFIGRFVGPVRSTVPMIAGLLDVTWRRFFLAAIPSAFLWAIAYLIPGILLGALSLELPHGKAGEFILIGLGIIIGIWLVIWLIQLFFRRLLAFTNRKIDSYWNWLNRHHSTRPLIRYITNRQQPNNHHQLSLFFVGLISGILFLILLTLVIIKAAFIAAINLPIFHLLQSIRTPHLDAFFIVMTSLGKSTTLIGVSVLLSLLFMTQKEWRSAAHLLAVIVATAGAVFVFKHLSHSARPTGFEIIQSGFSFPSGHMTFSMMTLGFIAFLLGRRINKDWRWLVYLCTSFIIGLICFSRLYLGAHWLTDFFGSLLLSASMMSLFCMHYQRYPKGYTLKNISLGLFSLGIAICIIIPWSLYTVTHFSKTRFAFQPIETTQNVTFKAWWDNPTSVTPVFRNNRFGKPAQPFNLQWADNLSHIEKILKQHGWQLITNEKTLRDTLKRFSSTNPEHHQPFFPWLYGNQKAMLLMIKHLPSSNDILELRLWRAHVHFTDRKTPLWIGTVDYHLSKPKQITVRQHTIFMFNGFNGLFKRLRSATKMKGKLVQIDLQNYPEHPKSLIWDGSILVLKLI